VPNVSIADPAVLLPDIVPLFYGFRIFSYKYPVSIVRCLFMPVIKESCNANSSHNGYGAEKVNLHIVILHGTNTKQRVETYDTLYCRQYAVKLTDRMWSIQRLEAERRDQAYANDKRSNSKGERRKEGRERSK
jgi:hypothetical protein